MKDKFILYGAKYGKRYTRKEKNKFLEHISVDFINSGYDVKLKKIFYKGQRHIHLCAGNFKEAQTIFVTSYDTPSKTLLKSYDYFPLNDNKNMSVDIKNLTVQTLLLIILAVCSIGLIKFGLTLSFFERIISIFTASILILFAIYISSNVANPLNMNRNTAAIIALLSLAQQLKDNKVAFILLDNNTTVRAGIQSIKKLRNINANFIYLDCIGNGDKLYGDINLSKEKDFRLFKESVRYYSVKTENRIIKEVFRNYVYLFRANELEGNLVVSKTRTKEDIHIDLKEIEELVSQLLQYCKLYERREVV